MSIGLSPKLPLTRDPKDGYTLNKDYVSMIRQNLKMLLLTAPGERIMEPVFGVGLRNFLFLQNSEHTHSIIEKTIREQVSMFMSFVEVVAVDISPVDTMTNSSESGLDIYLEFRIVPLDILDILLVTVES